MQWTDNIIHEICRRDEILPKTMGATVKPEGGANGDSRGQSPNDKAAAERESGDVEPPRATGGSAPALTPAGAFVGVPEGVAVTGVEDEPMEIE